MTFTPIHERTPVLTDLFRCESPGHVPGRLRFQAVLAGTMMGNLWTDNPHQPTWGILQERSFGTLTFAGTFAPGFIGEFIRERQQEGEVLYGFWGETDPLEAELPTPIYRGYVWESENRSAAVDVAALLAACPPDVEIRRIDTTLFPRVQDYEFFSAMFGSPERALELGFGFCAMRGDTLLSEAFAGPSADGLIEIGINTREGERRKGLATLACAATIQEAERRGLRTYWNCAAQNAPSIALAHKLGYAPMQKYRLLGW